MNVIFVDHNVHVVKFFKKIWKKLSKIRVFLKSKY